MNKNQRVQLKAMADLLRNLTATASAEAINGAADAVKDVVDQILEDEQGKYDNLTEGQQNGIVGERLMDAIEELECVQSYFDSFAYLNDAGTAEDKENAVQELHDCADNLEAI